MSNQIDADSTRLEALLRQLIEGVGSRSGYVSANLESLVQELRSGSEQTSLYVPVVVSGERYCMRYVLQEGKASGPGESALTFGLQFIVDEEER